MEVVIQVLGVAGFVMSVVQIYIERRRRIKIFNNYVPLARTNGET